MPGTISGCGDAAKGSEVHALQHLRVGPRGNPTQVVPCDPASRESFREYTAGQRWGWEKGHQPGETESRRLEDVQTGEESSADGLVWAQAGSGKMFPEQKGQCGRSIACDGDVVGNGVV